MILLSDVNTDIDTPNNSSNSHATFDERLAPVNYSIQTIQRLLNEYKAHQV